MGEIKVSVVIPVYNMEKYGCSFDRNITNIFDKIFSKGSLENGL